MNTYSTCKLAILHEVVNSLRHDKEVATSNRHEKGKEKEKGAGKNGSVPGDNQAVLVTDWNAPSKQAVEKGAGTKGKVGEKLKDEHQIEAVVVAKKAAKKLRKQLKAAVRENKNKQMVPCQHDLQDRTIKRTQAYHTHMCTSMMRVATIFCSVELRQTTMIKKEEGEYICKDGVRTLTLG